MNERALTREWPLVVFTIALQAACGIRENLVPHILACARAYCTLFEIREAMERVFGSYKEPVFF